MYTTLGCANDAITLSCPNDRTIVITKAHWGKYNLECENCCPPNPAYDCTVDMETAEPEFFEFIKFQCDGMTSCNLEYGAYLVNECEFEYTADYEQIFYDCNPFDETEIIAFTARLSSDITLSVNQVIPFNSVLRNFGGHYSTATYSFTCPVNVVYVFTVINA